MRTDSCEKLRGFVWVVSLALALMGVTACSDDKSVAGGSTEDAGIIAIKNLDVAGVTQKGPFVKGSAVTVQGIDCKTLKLTDEHFEGSVKSDKGDFTVKEVSLKSTCALFEVTGLYRSEITGKKSSKELTLRALTDLKDRENVNINILTNLEYERLLHLVTEKGKTFAEAKAQAEAEVLAAFDIAGSFEDFENLNIFESGDGNAALLAVSVMMQAKTDDAGLAKRLDKFTDSFAETGNWKDSATKATIADWAADAIAGNGLDSIRKNVEAWNIGDTVAAFEKYITAEFPDTVVYSSSANSSSSANRSSSSFDKESIWSYLNPNVSYGEFTDERDGQVYKYVEIEGRNWMAQNMNYATPNASSMLCPSAKEKSCSFHGLVYTWEEAVNVCPEGWHVPSYAEWDTLTSYLWANYNWDDVSPVFSMQPTNVAGFVLAMPDYDPLMRDSSEKYKDCYLDSYDPHFWVDSLYRDEALFFAFTDAGIWDNFVPTTTCKNQVRCIMDPVVSSSSVAISSGAESSSSVEPAKTALDFLNPAIEYGEFVDDRDNQTYKSVKIGDQVWMAQNLNYAYNQKTRSGSASSFCYGNEPDSCGKYGRLYLWSAALDSAAQFSDDAKGCGNEVVCEFEGAVRGVCPKGWHLPDTSEFRTLLNFVGDSSGTKLKANEAWKETYADPYGFSALPAGGYDYRDEDHSVYPHFDYAGELTYFWSIVSRDHDDGYALAMDYYMTSAKLYWSYKYNARSVRCLKD